MFGLPADSIPVKSTETVDTYHAEAASLQNEVLSIAAAKLAANNSDKTSQPLEKRSGETGAANSVLPKESQAPTYENWKQNRAAGQPDQIRVVSFNIANDGRYGLPGVIDLLKRSNADVIALQEAGENTAKIAQSLGYRYILHDDNALLTRLNIDSVSKGGNGVVMHTDSGKRFAFFGEHLYYKPYQPYQVLGIPYEDGKFVKTADEAIEEARKARAADVEAARKDIASLNEPTLPTIVVGDFNEPSHLDWTQKAVQAGLHPMKVEWPSSRGFAEDGFSDSYRQMYPDEVAHPGFTWTPTTRADDPKDHHDRIDYILHRGNGIKLKTIEIIGENSKEADIVVTPFPSDHRALTAVFELSETAESEKKTK